MAGMVIESFGVVFRAVAATIAALLIIRAVCDKCIPGSLHFERTLFFGFTEKIVYPVRKMLPSYISGKKMDYSPLILAVGLLFLGLGLDAFLRIVVREFLSS